MKRENEAILFGGGSQYHLVEYKDEIEYEQSLLN